MSSVAHNNYSAPRVGSHDRAMHLCSAGYPYACHGYGKPVVKIPVWFAPAQTGYHANPLHATPFPPLVHNAQGNNFPGRSRNGSFAPTGNPSRATWWIDANGQLLWQETMPTTLAPLADDAPVAPVDTALTAPVDTAPEAPIDTVPVAPVVAINPIAAKIGQAAYDNLFLRQNQVAPVSGPAKRKADEAISVEEVDTASDSDCGGSSGSSSGESKGEEDKPKKAKRSKGEAKGTAKETAKGKAGAAPKKRGTPKGKPAKRGPGAPRKDDKYLDMPGFNKRDDKGGDVLSFGRNGDIVA